MPRTHIVIPCFDEAQRLPRDRILEHARSHEDVALLLVNDGSRDATASVLEGLAASCPERISVLDLPENVGKAEAVRRGMQWVFEQGANYAGYFDADLATPLREIDRFVQVLDEDTRCEIVFGARVQLLGRHIERNPLRHYLGRIFATAASITLGLPVYDTQCGAKLFRAGPLASEIFARPFVSKWIFDVELLARVIAIQRRDGGPSALEIVTELPLLEWVDVAGSKLRTGDFLRAVGDLRRIHARYLRRGHDVDRA